MKISIIGGGSAGWMVASYISAKTSHEVVLVESPNFPIVGVGESTIPSIVDFMNDVGLTEQDLIDECGAIRKYGIQHNGWKNYNDSWWHMFCFDESEHDEQFSWMENLTLPKKKWRLAYHLDATRLGILLKEKVAIPNGVKHILDDIIHVEVNENGIKEVKGKKQTYTSDLFIDCTGFKSLLNKELGGKRSQHPGLINNYAVAGPGVFKESLVNYSQTYAMDYGWRWRVCLQHRTGNGYAFNKDIISVDRAVDELIKKTPGIDVGKIFEVPINNSVDYEPWKKNCVSMGLSCGFLEPLEATGLFLIHAPLKLLVRLLSDDQRQTKFNRVWRRMYHHIADFLSLHYRTSQLDHTEYWRSIPKIDKIILPQPNQVLFERYNYRQLAISRNIDYL